MVSSINNHFNMMKMYGLERKMFLNKMHLFFFGAEMSCKTKN